MVEPHALWYRLLKETVRAWSKDNAARLSAAVAFYTVLSSTPLLVVAVAVAGLVFGEEAARGLLGVELGKLVGPTAGAGIETLLVHAAAPTEGLLGSLVSLVVLLFGASAVFAELQAALNAIWNVEPNPSSGLWDYARQRFFTFLMVLGVAVLLLVSLVLSTLLSAAGKYFAHLLPGDALLWEVTNFVVAGLVIALLFALVFKIVPDTEVAWRDVWPGALATSLLFSVGKLVLGWYLGRASVASPYGAAGSVMVLVIWVYYAAQIFFFGAEFTHTFAEHRRGRGLPA
jgi:membrane protein